MIYYQLPSHGKYVLPYSFIILAINNNGVCSIFLRVDRSKNEIHKPRAILTIKVFNKKYVFI